MFYLISHNFYNLMNNFTILFCYLRVYHSPLIRADDRGGGWNALHTVERGNFGQGSKKHLTLSYSFDFLALVSALEVLTTVEKSKLQLKVKCFFSSCSKLPHLPKLPRSTVPANRLQHVNLHLVSGFCTQQNYHILL